MSRNDWERARALFQSALEQPEEARAAFLSQACDGDEAIRRDVESLIAAHAAAGGFLERPAIRIATEPAGAPALQPGDRLGTFEVLGVLGHGGMGEVYRARDARLERDVAIKVLPRAVAADPQRLARFDRESRILASFNHPNIAAIHSVEQFGDLRLLVLELVEGLTLADRLRQGSLRSDEALAVAAELAAALEAAHDRGVIHRDLKPANITLSLPSGIKLLDFGLAKETVGYDGERPGAPAVDATTEGLILGTCAYMSPEQARGKPVDKRTDIWAFGCVLYEMLAGRRAFPGDTASDTIAAVLEREPDWSRLPVATTPGIRRLLRRCLEKDPEHRLHDIADARIEIEDARSSPDDTSVPAPPAWRVGPIAATLTLCAAGVALGWWLHTVADSTQAANRPVRFTWTLPDAIGLDSPPTISHDGQRIAFTAKAAGGGPPMLYVRSLSQLSAEPLTGTEGAKQPFWSPDARSLGYFARGKLMKIALHGGTPVELCDAPDARGGTWSANGTIVFSPLLIESGLMRISESGGEVERATLLDVQQGENSHRWPAFLPDGIHFLYFVRTSNDERRGVYVGHIDGPAATPGTPLFLAESEAVYAPIASEEEGVLLTAAAGRVEARPFDARHQQLIGDPLTLDLPAADPTPYHGMMLTVSEDVLAHTGSSVPFGNRLTVMGRNGETEAVDEQRRAQGSPRLSPDGRRLAWTLIDEARGRPELWVTDLGRGTRLRVTSSPVGLLPVWSPDGERLAHVAESVQKGVLTIAAADGTGVVSTVQCPGLLCDPTDWSGNGRWLLATVYSERDQDVWMLPADGREAARALLAEPFPERDARFSPDGRMVAYVSEETGHPEVSIQTLEARARRDVLSVAGGDQPVWNHNGRELFFVDSQGLLRSVPVSTTSDGRPAFGAPVALDVPAVGTGHRAASYDVSPDGRRIYYFDRRPGPPPSEFGVVVGWRGLLK